MIHTCPSAETLERLLNEELTDPLLEEVAHHLESCGRCQDFCETLTQRMDTASAVESEGSGKVLDALIHRLVDSHQSLHGLGSPGANQRLQFTPPYDDRAPMGRLGHYAIQELIAEGAQGVLYRGHDEILNRTVAIKIVHPRLTQSAASMERFRREARLIAAVQSDHVVRVFQVGSEPGFPPFLVMEFVAGESLQDLIARRDPIPFRLAVQMIRDAASGLQAAHQKGLIHRDVKPSNILLDRSTSRARLTDFGLALDEADATRMTQEGTILGTPAYMSPEQVTRPETADARSDLYSLAVVFYELLTAEVPFRGTLRMTLLQVVHEEARHPRQYNDAIPKDLETICLKGMSKDPASRFQDAAAFIDELDRWLSGRAILSRPVSGTERVWRWCQRNPMVSLLCATVLVLLLTLSTVMTWSSIRLSASSEASRLSAVAAQEQSLASLETLSQLIFQLQEHFDHDETDIDELQRDTLQIALAGLRKVRLSADSKNAPQLPTAAALRRMGELLSRLGEDDEALSCLQQAESIVRLELKSDPNHPETIKTLVEVLSSRGDFELYSADNHDAMIREAVTLARLRGKLAPSDSATFMLAGALMRLGGLELDAGDTEAAAVAFQESMTLSESFTSDDSEYTIASQLNWLSSADSFHVAILGTDEAAALKHLQIAIQKGEILAKSRPDDVDLALYAVGLQERLVTYRENVAHAELPQQAAELQVAIDSFQRNVEAIASLSLSDWDAYYKITLRMSEFIDQRIAEDNLLSASRLTQTMIAITRDRLKVDPADSFTQGELARYFSTLADLKSELGDSATEVVSCYEESLVEYRALSKTSWFEEDDWIDYLEVLFSAADFAVEAQHESQRSLREEIRSVLAMIREKHPDFDPDWQAEFSDQLMELESPAGPDTL